MCANFGSVGDPPCLYQGRWRRRGTGFDHQRPLQRHRSTGASTGAEARGQATSMAATMAAASSSLGAGVMEGGHSGVFPCLRGGSSSRLDRSIDRPSDSLWRVRAGSITSST